MKSSRECYLHCEHVVVGWKTCSCAGLSYVMFIGSSNPKTISVSSLHIWSTLEPFVNTSRNKLPARTFVTFCHIWAIRHKNRPFGPTRPSWPSSPLRLYLSACIWLRFLSNLPIHISVQKSVVPTLVPLITSEHTKTIESKSILILRNAKKRLHCGLQPFSNLSEC